MSSSLYVPALFSLPPFVLLFLQALGHLFHFGCLLFNHLSATYFSNQHLVALRETQTLLARVRPTKEKRKEFASFSAYCKFTVQARKNKHPDSAADREVLWLERRSTKTWSSPRPSAIYKLRDYWFFFSQEACYFLFHTTSQTL